MSDAVALSVIARVEAKLDRMEAQMTHGLEAITGRLAGIEGRLSGLEARICALEDLSADTTARLERIERRLVWLSAA